MRCSRVCPFPVGAIYQSVDATDPADVYEHTQWARLEDVFLYACGPKHAAGESGGSETVTLTVAQMPVHTHVQDAHNHTQNAHTHTQNAHAHTVNGGAVSGGITGGSHNHAVTTYGDTNSSTTVRRVRGTTYANIPAAANGGTGSSTHSHNLPAHTHSCANATPANQNATATNKAATATNQNAGGGQAHENMPPYLAIHVWKRDA